MWLFKEKIRKPTEVSLWSKNERCINKHTGTCFVCNSPLGKKRKWNTHHIIRVPSITIRVHKKCHEEIEHSDKYKHLKPGFYASDLEFLKWLYYNRDKLLIIARSLAFIRVSNKELWVADSKTKYKYIKKEEKIQAKKARIISQTSVKLNEEGRLENTT